MPKFDGASVRIVNLAESSDVLEGFDFNDCDIVGPAVLAVLDHVTMTHNSFDGDMESVLWEVPRTRTRVLGAIGIRNCTFRDCRFHRIGLAGTAEFVVAFITGTGSTGVTSPSPSSPASQAQDAPQSEKPQPEKPQPR